jgi:hypothetical protein
LAFNGYPWGLNDGSYYVGDAAGTLGTNNIVMWCVDPLHEIMLSPWNVDVVSLASPGVELNGLLGLTVADYETMFLLGQQFTNTNQTIDVALQHEIWSFANPSAYPLSVAEQGQKDAALATIGDYDFLGADVLVPQGDPSGWTGQVFETGTATMVPEPAFILLLGLGLMGVVLAAGGRKQKN